MKLICWNVNGIRASVKKGFIDTVAEINPDILCLQETKAQADQIDEALDALEGYHIYSNSAVRKGYSGTAILSKTEATNVIRDIDVEKHDQEGRVITAEFNDYYLVCVYVPNSGQELVRLDYRKTWDQEFLKFLKALEKTKPVIACGDFNVAHQEIDIARPKPNYNKTAGYTQTEIDGFTNFVNTGFIDTFRHQHPDTVAYSWWSFRANARAKNIGWRIDYCLVTPSLIDAIQETFIMPEIMGSDHCPIGLVI